MRKTGKGYGGVLRWYVTLKDVTASGGGDEPLAHAGFPLLFGHLKGEQSKLLRISFDEEFYQDKEQQKVLNFSL